MTRHSPETRRAAETARKNGWRFLRTFSGEIVGVWESYNKPVRLHSPAFQDVRGVLAWIGGGAAVNP